jgi:topoisomerase IA-like protein
MSVLKKIKDFFGVTEDIYDAKINELLSVDKTPDKKVVKKAPVKKTAKKSPSKKVAKKTVKKVAKKAPAKKAK